MYRCTVTIVAALLLASASVQAQTATITTVAGNGTAGFCGDGGPATSACLTGPNDVAFGPAGDLFIAGGYRIRKVSTTGTITTVAGNGTDAYCGDGGPATSACIGAMGVAVDTAGAIFIADYLSNRVRRVDPITGIITTVAGGGASCPAPPYGAFSGDGGPATDACLFSPIDVAIDTSGDLFIADSNNSRIRKVNAVTGVITTVTDGGAWGVTVDGSGNLYISAYSLIRKVDTGGAVTTVAGGGVGEHFCGDGGPATDACIWGARGVVVDAAGTLFIGDTNNDRVRKVDALTHIITTMAGTGSSTFCGDGGPATSACLYLPRGVVLDGSGNLFIADWANHRVRKVTSPAALGLAKTAWPTTYTAVGQTISYSYIVTNTGTVTLAGPFSVSDDKTTDESCPATPTLAPGASITCTASYKITQADLDSGSVTNTATATNGTTTSNSAGATVTGIPARALAIIKTATPTTYNAVGQTIGYSYVVTNTGNVTLYGPFTVSDNKVTVSCPGTPSLAPLASITCTASHTITAADLSVGSITNIASASNGTVTSPSDTETVVATSAGPIIDTAAGLGSPGYAGDGGPARSATVGYPYGVAWMSGGSYVLTMPNNHVVRKVSATRTISTVAGTGAPGFCGDGGLAATACLNDPRGIATDAAGAVFVADSKNHRVRKITPAGKISTVAGNGTAGFCGDGGKATKACLNEPSGVFVATDGTLFIADRNNHRVRMVSPAGTISTVAGNGTVGYCGDDGPATSACLNYPSDVEVSAAGALFVSDYYNHRVRKVDGAGTIATVVGTGTAGFCGDGGPAVSACVNGPLGLDIDATGALFIADYYNDRVRKVDRAGTIATLVGSGSTGFCGDGGAPTSACLWRPVEIAVNSGGALLISDHLNHRVRSVSSPMASVTLTKTALSGCLSTKGKVTLAAPAPSGGTVVTLASDNPYAAVPARLTFKPGVLAMSFTILTSPVASTEVAGITASTGGVTGGATLTLNAIAPLSVSLAPNPVTGGNPVSGTVTLDCVAAPGDIVVALTSSKPAVAAPATATVTVPAGVQTGTFTVVTKPVTVVTKPAIKATAHGVTKSKTLIVNPGS